MGDKKAAIASANEGIKLALANPNPGYIRLNKEVLSDAMKCALMTNEHLIKSWV